MRQIALLLSVLASITLVFSCNKRSGEPRILVFSKTADFVHSSIPVGIAAIQQLGQSNKIKVDTSSNADIFQDDSLKQYSAIVFLSTTGDVLNASQQTAMERYIQSGGGFVGIHAAADTEYDWGWYGRMTGAYFESHPAIQKATIVIKDKSHAATKDLPETWSTTDEWYNYKKIQDNLHVLMTLDESSYQGGKNGASHPIAWYHEYDGGRAFYTGLGHTEEKYSDPLFLKHLLGGIRYAIGDNKELNLANAKSEYAPDEDRFTKTILTQGTLTEPTEMTILPNLDVLITQRRGEILLYKNETKTIRQVGLLNVYWRTDAKDVNAEEGLLGIQADPEFSKNHWVYMYYSPADSSVNRLSRFEFKNDSLDLKSEKVVLQFYSQRDICCHTGGSIAFGPDRTLFLSTGDNSTPFDEPGSRFVNHGFAPLDDRPGHHQYDARRTSANTNDLRGKIIRITINEDGTYSIPEGNLFPGKSDKTRPEIFVMGDRNPYRITVDKKSGFLYWGEVGPDAANDSLETRGPRGYDEVNQARKAGFFGWPLFIGNNYPYHLYNYSTGATEPLFDPEKPVNNSLNNTGLKELPPAQPAFIWYPYNASHDFPQVGSGGRTAMAGPVYHGADYPKETRYADYYNGKLFIYEWIRGWIKVVTMLPNGDFDRMEPFMEHTKFSAPQDMELGPDGRLYVLEYGSGWFTKNPEAGLSRIDFNSGNRPPKIAKLSVDKETGVLPFRLTAKVDAKDPETEDLTYLWDLGNGTKKETKEPKLDITYTTVGDYGISVTVSDNEKASSKSEVVTVYAGNETPHVDISLKGNESIYFPGKPLGYQVNITDNDEQGSPQPAGLQVLADFVEGTDKAAVPPGHLSVSETMMGRNIMLSLDCKACHQEAQKSVGPAYTQVALKYKNDPNATTYLVDKIRKGGAGVWGEVAMSAHPDVPENDLQQIVKWIMSLSNTKTAKSSLPPAGHINPAASEKRTLYLTATYSDQGAAGIKPLTGKKTLVLRNNVVSMREVRRVQGFSRKDTAGNRFLVLPANQGSFFIDSMDLAGIKAVELRLMTLKPLSAGYHLELHMDSPGGNMWGEADLGKIQPSKNAVTISIPVSALHDHKFSKLYLVAKRNSGENNTILLESLRFIPE